jgi:hypothetical protein
MSALPWLFVTSTLATCVRDSRVIKIPRDLVEAAIQEHPGEGLAVLKNLTAIIAGRLRVCLSAACARGTGAVCGLRPAIAHSGRGLCDQKR